MAKRMMTQCVAPLLALKVGDTVRVSSEGGREAMPFFDVVWEPAPFSALSHSDIISNVNICRKWLMWSLAILPRSRMKCVLKNVQFRNGCSFLAI